MCHERALQTYVDLRTYSPTPCEKSETKKHSHVCAHAHMGMGFQFSYFLYGWGDEVRKSTKSALLRTKPRLWALSGGG